MSTHDVAVIGLGGIGSSVLAELARRGLDAVGLDRHAPPHDLGSTHGRTRVFRLAYFEHPDYVPLLVEARTGWRSLEAETGRDLYRETGVLEVGPPDGMLVPGVLAAAETHGLTVERFDADGLRAAFPRFTVADDQVGAFEPRAGVLAVEDAVAAALDVARRHGAEVRTGEAVTALTPDGSGWSVVTDRATLAVGSVVVAAGPWAPRVLAGPFPAASGRLSLRRKSLFWFRTAEPAPGVGPAFAFERGDRIFYGFPEDDLGLKVAEHTDGHPVDDPAGVDRTIDPAERDRLVAFLKAHLPHATTDVTHHAACLYTDTPDGHFIVDRLPGDAPGAVVAGLSGHGFKFAPALGSALADLATEGRTDLPIEFLAANRFG